MLTRSRTSAIKNLGQWFIVLAGRHADIGAAVTYSRGESSMTMCSLRTWKSLECLLPPSLSSDLDGGRREVDKTGC